MKPLFSPILAEIPIISRNCINYREVTEHNLGHLFAEVPAPPIFLLGGRVWLHVGHGKIGFVQPNIDTSRERQIIFKPSLDGVI